MIRPTIKWKSYKHGHQSSDAVIGKTKGRFGFETHAKCAEYREISLGELISYDFQNESDHKWEVEVYLRKGDGYGFSKRHVQLVLLQAPIKNFTILYPQKACPLLLITEKWRYAVAPRLTQSVYDKLSNTFCSEEVHHKE